MTDLLLFGAVFNIVVILFVIWAISKLFTD